MVVTKTSFIGGRLVHPGELVEVDAKDPTGFAPVRTTPVGNMTDEQLQQEMDRRKGDADKAEPVYGSNVAVPGPKMVGMAIVEIAPITVSSPGATVPQGIPPGSTGYGGAYIGPASAETDGGTVQFVQGDTAAEGGDASSSVSSDDTELRASEDYKAVTTAELRDELDEKGVDYEGDANKTALFRLARG